MNIPVIGICISMDRTYVLPIVEKRLRSYPRDREAEWVLFDRDSIDDGAGTIIGRRWDPQAQAFGEVNESLPLPHAVYMQCIADRPAMIRLENLLGQNRLFNNYMFDKWQCWNLLSVDSVFRALVPDTRLFGSESDLREFLVDYRDIFIKPIDPEHGHSSNGIIRLVLQADETVHASYSSGMQMNFSSFGSTRHFYDWFEPSLTCRPYIVQETIVTDLWMSGAADIRLHMNKNGAGQWEFSHALFRIAQNRSHVIPSQIMMLTMDKWRSMFPAETQRIDGVERELIELGCRVGELMDHTGYHMADIGIDLGMKRNGELRIFEINPLPTPLLNKLESTSEASLTRPLDYALYVVG
ncbi:YheC/YheD family protein [Paenibacillus hodogayensis]|uniref:YheC/YheD family protein n=1 Tax=Paenibacillus hodogayensis TaxID=279208 RepID=A0ABV5W2U3_9BACL